MSAGYFDKPIRFATGLIATGAAIAVRDTGGTLADIFSNEALSVSKANPGVVDADGRFIFYADQGEYDITVGAGASAATYRVFLGANADLTFSSRSDLVTWWASNSVDAPSWVVVSDGAVQYVKDGGTGISDLPGLSPLGAIKMDHWGVVFDGETATHTAAQSAIDYVASIGGGIIKMPAGTAHIDTTWEITTGVHLYGEGVNSTTLKLGSGVNDDVIRTKDFATQTGNNLWYIDTEGVHHGFGFVGFSVDGNSANNTSGGGIRIYGKRFVVDQVFIRDCQGEGWYSEAANKSGQHDWRDTPECDIGSLWVRECGQSGVPGFRYRGPHDGRIKKLIVNGQKNVGGSDNVSFETSAGVYGGSADVGFIHSHASNGRGFVTTANGVKVSEIVSEGNVQEALDIIADDCRIGKVYAFNNNVGGGAGSYHNIVFGGQDCYIAEAYVRDENDGGAILVSTSRNGIGYLTATSDGNANTQPAVDIDADYFTLGGGIVAGYSGAGGCAVKLTATNAANNNVSMSVTNCSTALINSGGGKRNIINLTGDLLSGQAVHSGAGRGATEDWTLLFDVNGSSKLSRQSGVITDTTDADGDLVIPLTLYATPTHVSYSLEGAADLTATLQNKGANSITVQIRSSGVKYTSSSVTVNYSAEV